MRKLTPRSSPSRRNSQSRGIGNQSAPSDIIPRRRSAPSNGGDVPRSRLASTQIILTLSSPPNGLSAGSLGSGCQHSDQTSLAGGVKRISAVSWNARALLCADPAVTKKKVSVLWRLLLDTDIASIQEAHGNDASVRTIAAIHNKTHYMHYSQHPNHMSLRYAMQAPYNPYTCIFSRWNDRFTSSRRKTKSN